LKILRIFSSMYCAEPQRQKDNNKAKEQNPISTEDPVEFGFHELISSITFYLLSPTLAAQQINQEQQPTRQHRTG